MNRAPFFPRLLCRRGPSPWRALIRFLPCPRAHVLGHTIARIRDAAASGSGPHRPLFGPRVPRGRIHRSRPRPHPHEARSANDGMTSDLARIRAAITVSLRRIGVVTRRTDLRKIARLSRLTGVSRRPPRGWRLGQPGLGLPATATSCEHATSLRAAARRRSVRGSWAHSLSLPRRQCHPVPCESLLSAQRRGKTMFESHDEPVIRRLARFAVRRPRGAQGSRSRCVKRRLPGP